MTIRPDGSTTALKYLCLLLLAGCTGAPARVLPPSIDPDGASQRAVSQYDANGDGNLSANELDKCAAIKRLMPLYDIDKDQQISAEEIANRIREWQKTKVALITVQCLVRMNGQPLPGAIVKFTPEDYLGDTLKVATGVTDDSGYADLAVDDADLPDDQKGLKGVQVGVYKVSITHPSRPIAPQFNTATKLGLEVARDNMEILNLTYNVTSR